MRIPPFGGSPAHGAKVAVPEGANRAKLRRAPGRLQPALSNPLIFPHATPGSIELGLEFSECSLVQIARVEDRLE